MKASMKFMLILLLLVLSFGISGSIVDSQNESPEAEVLYQLAEDSAHDNDSAIAQYLVGESKTRSLSVSDVEASFRVVESYSFSSNYRLRRIIENNDSFKSVMHKFSLLRENSRLLDQSKSYRSDQDPHYSVISSDYYVFALRHILI